jgi:hypothetical protein
VKTRDETDGVGEVFEREEQVKAMKEGLSCCYRSSWTVCAQARYLSLAGLVY